jgi:septum site-determining protein MinD
MPNKTQVITLFSTKGGVGKTFLTSNLAVGLSYYQNKSVCLLDMDLYAIGDMARILGVSPKYCLVNLISQIKKNPDTLMERFLTTAPAGVKFIPAILRPQQSPHLNAEFVKDIFNRLMGHFDFIIVDAGKNFTEILMTVLNKSNLILLVVTPDTLSIYQTRWILDTLQSLHFPLKIMRIILNRAETPYSVSRQEVMASVPSEIIAQLPSEGKNVNLSINRGVPLLLDNPRSRLAIKIKELTEKLVTEEDLFLPQQEIDLLKLKESGSLEKTGEFWLVREMAEVLPEEEEEKDEILRIKRRIHNRLINELNLKRLDLKVFSDAKKTKDLREKASQLISNLLVEETGSFISSEQLRNRLVKEIVDEALGLGPLEEFLADPEITDIMVNNKDEIYIERKGKIELTNKKFTSNEQVRTVIERIIAPIGRHIDESVPMVDARLPDGSRVNAIISPLSLTGPTLTIRKFRKEKFKIEELINMGTLNQSMADFLKACVLARKNMIVSGGTGSGKTTMLNVLSEFIPDNERIITIEDAAELKLHQAHWIRLEARPPNIEGKGAITIRDLFRNSLRMRPDRIIIGECRGQETLDMLQAMNTGHDGSMTTLHANSTHDVLVRLDSLILMSGMELPIKAIREMISSAIDIIVHTARLSDGSRKVIQITEVAGMLDEIHINLKDIFIFKQTGVDNQGNVIGYFTATGYFPTFFEEIKTRGIYLPEDIFKPTIP